MLPWTLTTGRPVSAPAGAVSLVTVPAPQTRGTKMAENETETVEETTEETVEVAEEIADAVVDAVEDANEPAENDVDVTVIEAPEPEEKEAAHASVDVGDLHISGPASMVEKVTETYLKNHIDHNPHGEPHTEDNILEGAQDTVEGGVSAVTPDVVEEQIQEQAAEEIADEPPGPTDWLFRNRGRS